jgi:hypothetical protein
VRLIGALGGVALIFGTFVGPIFLSWSTRTARSPAKGYWKLAGLLFLGCFLGIGVGLAAAVALSKSRSSASLDYGVWNWTDQALVVLGLIVGWGLVCTAILSAAGRQQARSGSAPESENQTHPVNQGDPPRSSLVIDARSAGHQEGGNTRPTAVSSRSPITTAAQEGNGGDTLAGNIERELNALGELRDSGRIDKLEYQTLRKRILEG